MKWKCVQWRLCGIRECKYIGWFSSEIATANLRRLPPRFLWPNFPSQPSRTRFLCVDCACCETPLILRKFAEVDVVYSSEIALYLMCVCRVEQYRIMCLTLISALLWRVQVFESVRRIRHITGEMNYFLFSRERDSSGMCGSVSVSVCVRHCMRVHYCYVDAPLIYIAILVLLLYKSWFWMWERHYSAE